MGRWNERLPIDLSMLGLGGIWRGLYQWESTKAVLESLGYDGITAFDLSPPATSVNSVISPSSMVAIADSRPWISSSKLIWADPILSPVATIETGATAIGYLNAGTQLVTRASMIQTDRHSGGTIFVCVDGHVETMKNKLLYDMSNDEIRRRWNTDNNPHVEFKSGF